MKYFYLITLFCLLGLVRSMDVMAEPAAASEQNLEIGVILGLTGPADRWSKYQRMGMELAASDLNQAGSRIKLIFDDSASQPKKAVASFTHFTANRGVAAVLGDVFSMVTEPMIPMADAKKILLISPATPVALCARSKEYFFSTATQVPAAAEGYGYFLDRHPEVKKVALIYFQDPGWGYQYRDGWKKLLQSRGVTITDEYESADFVPDFKSALPKMLHKNPDAFFVAHEPKGFISAAKQLNFKGSLVFANNILELPAGGENPQWLNGVYFVDTLASVDFARRFKEKFGQEPLLEPYNGYEAVRAFVKAMELDPASPQKAMRTLSYDGISGPLDFRDSCAGNKSRWHLKVFENEKIKLIQ